MVSVHVGPAQEIFHIHKPLICSASPFFKNALDGEFKEAHEQTVSMSADSPEIFDLFTVWLYNRADGLSKRIRAADPNIASVFDKLIKLYILADKIRAIELQNDMILDFYSYIAGRNKITQFSHSAIYSLYDPSASAATPLRIMAIAYHTYHPPPISSSMTSVLGTSYEARKLVGLRPTWQPTRRGGMVAASRRIR